MNGDEETGSEAADVVFNNLDLLQQVLQHLHPLELARVNSVSSVFRMAVRQMPHYYWKRQFQLESSLDEVPASLQVQSWREAYIAMKYAPDLVPIRYEARFNALVDAISQWDLVVYRSDPASHKQYTQVSTLPPQQVIRNRQSLWIRFAVPSWMKESPGQDGHKVLLRARDRSDSTHVVIEDSHFVWPASDTHLMEMSHTTGFYPWDPREGEDGVDSDPPDTPSDPALPLQLMAYVHFEQLVPSLHAVEHGQALYLPCRPSDPSRLMVFPSLALMKLVADFNTVHGEWLGRLEAWLAAEQIGGASVRFTCQSNIRRPLNGSPPASLILPVPGATPITEPQEIQRHLDRICGETECMIDFAVHDFSPAGKGALLVGRSGVEIWINDTFFTGPFLAPGQGYSSRNKLLLYGAGVAGIDPEDGTPVVHAAASSLVVYTCSLVMSEDCWRLLVDDMHDRWETLVHGMHVAETEQHLGDLNLT